MTRMTRGQICNGLQEISDEAYSRWVHHQYTRDKLIIGIGTYVEEAIRLLKEQEPRLLTLDEVTEIGRKESGRTSGEDVNPVWLEEITTLLGKAVKTLYMVLLSKPFDFPDAGEEMFYAKYFGTDLDDALRPEKYGKRWRCWSAKPSKEQREAVKWDAADKC